MKTEKEKKEAGKKEQRIKRTLNIANDSAVQVFREATNNEEKRIFQNGINSNAQQASQEATAEEFRAIFEGYDEAKLRWEQFVSSKFEILKAALRDNQSAYIEDLSEVRSDWKVCPNCGLPATRYQGFCSDEKCDTNLETGKRR